MLLALRRNVGLGRDFGYPAWIIARAWGNFPSTVGATSQQTLGTGSNSHS